MKKIAGYAFLAIIVAAMAAELAAWYPVDLFRRWLERERRHRVAARQYFRETEEFKRMRMLPP